MAKSLLNRKLTKSLPPKPIPYSLLQIPSMVWIFRFLLHRYLFKFSSLVRFLNVCFISCFQVILWCLHVGFFFFLFHPHLLINFFIFIFIFPDFYLCFLLCFKIRILISRFIFNYIYISSLIFIIIFVCSFQFRSMQQHQSITFSSVGFEDFI